MGNSSSTKITFKERAILDLKVQRDKLKVYQKKLKAISDRETKIAKHHLANKDRKRALLALKKKKYQEQLLDQTDAQLLQLEQLTLQVENALMEQEFLKGLEQGNAVLKVIHNEMKIEDVEKLMQDTREAIEYQEEIEQILSEKITSQDEDEILKELDALIDQQLALPEIPIADLPVPKESESGANKVETKKKEKVTEEQMEPVLA